MYSVKHIRYLPPMLICLLLVTAVLLRTHRLDPAHHGIETTIPNNTVSNRPEAATDPESIEFVVNKAKPLPDTYTPKNLRNPNVASRLNPNEPQMLLRDEAAAALEKMFAGADRDGVKLVFGSGYRSYDLQKQFYDQYVASDGQQKADTYSARPGYSEHQTGLAADITTPDETCHLEICFEATPEGKWIADHAQEYGFIVRYPKDLESKTGYQYEPWHLRYVGIDISIKLYNTKQTLEEYFGLTTATDYQ